MEADDIRGRHRVDHSRRALHGRSNLGLRRRLFHVDPVLRYRPLGGRRALWPFARQGALGGRLCCSLHLTVLCKLVVRHLSGLARRRIPDDLVSKPVRLLIDLPLCRTVLEPRMAIRAGRHLFIHARALAIPRGSLFTIASCRVCRHFCAARHLGGFDVSGLTENSGVDRRHTHTPYNTYGAQNLGIEAMHEGCPTYWTVPSFPVVFTPPTVLHREAYDLT